MAPSTRRSLGSQVLRFGLVGLTTLGLDFAAYRTLLLLGVPVPVGKTAGFLVGTTAAYLLNRVFTFGHSGGRRAVVTFVVLYTVTLLLNVGINQVTLQLLAGPAHIRRQAHLLDAVTGAFLVAQAVTSAANFVGMRWLVFPHEHPGHGSSSP